MKEVVTPFAMSAQGDDNTSEDLDEFLKAQQETWSKAQASLHKGKEVMAKQANKRRSDVSFQFGDLVLVSAKHMCLPELLTAKFNHRFYGPYKVLRCINNAKFKLELPPRL